MWVTAVLIMMVLCIVQAVFILTDEDRRRKK